MVALTPMCARATHPGPKACLHSSLGQRPRLPASKRQRAESPWHHRAERADGSGLQPFFVLRPGSWGLAPGWDESRRWRKSARGFTLIELLAVIAIIALLATLATAGWQRSLRYSRSVVCMQNLRQIGSGLTRYVSEHDGVFPELAMARMSKTDKVPVLDTELRAYVSDARVFSCPDDGKHLAQTSGTSYLWNNKLNGQRLANLSVSFLAMHPIEEPSNIMVMGDKEGFHPNLENKLNVLYADGHASQELTFVPDKVQ